MAQEGYLPGKDAAYIKPKLVPDSELRARDNSGGLDYEPRTAAFGDGGEPVGPKSHLSATTETGKEADSVDVMVDRKKGEKGNRD